MKAEGRIFDWNWANYDGKHVVFYPKRMTPEVLLEGFFWANRQFFSLPSILTRISSTGQRLAARWLMNWRFRHLVHRTCPKGEISPLSQILKKLHVQFPSVDTGHFIPNALHAMKTSVQETSIQIDRFLKMKVKKHEGLTTLMIDLEGTLDRFNVTEVKKRVVEAARKARMDIVINFEHLRHAAPEALQTLLDWTQLQRLAPAVRIKVLNLKASFQQALTHPLPLGIEIAKEELLG
jgi:anti-anti-sigma regulatory factor